MEEQFEREFKVDLAEPEVFELLDAPKHHFLTDKLVLEGQPTQQASATGSPVEEGEPPLKVRLTLLLKKDAQLFKDLEANHFKQFVNKHENTSDFTEVFDSLAELNSPVEVLLTLQSGWRLMDPANPEC